MTEQTYFRQKKSFVGRTILLTVKDEEKALADIRKAVLRLKPALTADGIQDLEILWSFGRFLWADFSDNHMPAQLMDYASFRNSSGVDFPGKNYDICITLTSQDESFLEVAEIELMNFIEGSFELQESYDFDGGFEKNDNFLLGDDDEGLGGGTYVLAQNWTSPEAGDFAVLKTFSRSGGQTAEGYFHLGFSRESWRFEDALETLTQQQVSEVCCSNSAGYYFAPSHELLVKSAQNS